MAGVSKTISNIAGSLSGLFSVLGAVAKWKALKEITDAIAGLEKVKKVDTVAKNLKGLSGVFSGLKDVLTSGDVIGSITTSPTLATKVGAIGTTMAATIASAFLGYNGGKWGAYLVSTIVGDM